MSSTFAITIQDFQASDNIIPAIPNLKLLTLPGSAILLFFQTVHEFSTNKRMPERKFVHSWPIRGWLVTQIAQFCDYLGSDLELLISFLDYRGVHWYYARPRFPAIDQFFCHENNKRP